MSKHYIIESVQLLCVFVTSVLSISSQLSTRKASQLQLLSNVIKHVAKNYFPPCCIGDAGVGKTSIVRRYTDGVFTSAGIPTIGVDFCIKTLNIDNSAIKVLLIMLKCIICHKVESKVVVFNSP